MFDAVQIQSAVTAICPEIQRRIEDTALVDDERVLWWELSTCVLSSQVPYSLATASADLIDEARILVEHNVGRSVEAQLFDALSQPVNVNGRLRAYRFPAAKASQLAQTHQRVWREAGGLGGLVSGLVCAEDTRHWLIKYAPGLGPKQASMFLRNIGLSYDLAVLDRHVLRYMELSGLGSNNTRGVNTISAYRDMEESLRVHADQVGCSVGILDWAIWIVMRVVNQSKVRMS